MFINKNYTFKTISQYDVIKIYFVCYIRLHNVRYQIKTMKPYYVTIDIMITIFFYVLTASKPDTRDLTKKRLLITKKKMQWINT